MSLKYTTPVPNLIFDTFLPSLNKSELKVLLVIIRQTNGWIDRRTGKRKQFDWIASSQFERKTGLKKRIISIAIDSLVNKGLIEVRSRHNKVLRTPKERQGKKKLYLGLTILFSKTEIKSWRLNHMKS